MKKLFQISLALLLLSGCKVKEEVDLIIYNARITTVNPEMPEATHMAVHEGRIVAIGNEREVTGNYQSQTMQNAGGGFIYPGFFDSHCHFFGYAQTLAEINLVDSRSFREVVDRVKARADSDNSGGWLTGRGWDQNLWEHKSFPDNAVLDSLFPDRPVLLRRVDGHAAIANTAALNAAGISAGSVIEGGRIVTENGRLTGLLIDNAVEPVRKAVPELSHEQLIMLLKEARDSCLTHGLTTIVDAGLDRRQVEILDSLQQAGEMPLRFHIMYNPEEENFESIRKGEFPDSERLSVKAFKIYADGALGSRGALLKQPYSDDSVNVGLQLTSEEKIREILEFCMKYNCQAATHCIGDSSAALVLNLYGQYLNGTNDRRWRIEHAQVVSPGDVQLFKEFTVIPSVQPFHAVSDMSWAGERLGNERVTHAYAYKSLLKQNGIIALGSDCPVEDINPMLGYYAAVARKGVNGLPQHGWNPAEKISRHEALNGLTIWGAIATFAEPFSGSLEVGKVADFVIINKDLLQCEEADIPGISVLNTYISGRRVH